jgi:hypothetical protein
MKYKTLCRDYVGRRVKLTYDTATRGGMQFKKGEVLKVIHTYRGGFTLKDESKPDRTIRGIRRDGVLLLKEAKA